MTSHSGRYEKARKTLLLTLLMLILTTLNVNLVRAWNYLDTNLSIDYHDTPLILDLSLVPSTEFEVNITVNYVEKLWAYQVKLGEADLWELDPVKYQGWNASILNLVKVENGPFLGSIGGTVKFYPGDINNTQGTLTLTAGLLDPARRFPTGGGTLATLTFKVVGIGGSPIRFGLDSGLLNKTEPFFQFGGVWLRGTPPPPPKPGEEPLKWNPDFLVDGYFDNRPMSADLVRRSAWPEHHHYSISSDSDPNERHGTPGYQTLSGRVKNLADTEVYVKVVFNITKVGGSSILNETLPSEEPLAPGQVIDLTFDFGPFAPEDEGKYSVIARCWYSPDGTLWIEGQKTKRFTFSIVS